MTAGSTELWTEAASREASGEGMEAPTEKSSACTCRKASTKATGASMRKTLKHYNISLPGTHTEGTKASTGQREPVQLSSSHGIRGESPAESCMDFHHQNDQADGRSRKTYTNQVHICCELRLLNYVSTEK